MTINSPDTCRERVFPEFEKSAVKAGKDPSKMERMVEIPLHFVNKDGGIEEIRKSGNAGFLARDSLSETDPRKIQEMSFTVDDEKIKDHFSIVYSQDDLIETIEKYFNSGATHAE